MFEGARCDAFRALAKHCLLHRFGGDCYNYAMLAAGFIDLVVEAQLKPFDIVPLIPILEGAGCVVTDWAGARARRWRVRRRGRDTRSCTRLHWPSCATAPLDARFAPPDL